MCGGRQARALLPHVSQPRLLRIMDTITRTQPMILPIDFEGTIYVLEDEHGKIIGAGTRKACELLLSLITTKLAMPDHKAEQRGP